MITKKNTLIKLKEQNTKHDLKVFLTCNLDAIHHN